MGLNGNMLVTTLLRCFHLSPVCTHCLDQMCLFFRVQSRGRHYAPSRAHAVLALCLICIAIATGQTTTTPGYYGGTTTTTPATLTATCGGGCGCSSPMSASTLITDGSADSVSAFYNNNLRCWWQIVGSRFHRFLRFHRFNTETNYDQFIVKVCTSAACTNVTQTLQYSGKNSMPLETDITYDGFGDFLYITFTSDVSVPSTGFSVSYGTTATTTTYTATQCEVGTYCVNGVKTPCPAGTFADVIGSWECTACSAGKYSTAIGATSVSTCSSCPAGTYSSIASVNGQV
jgi:hypothetical protein